jgi:uncharacterized protein with HEPN domain
MQHDLIRVRHMLTAAKEAMEFAAGKTRMDLEKDRLHMLAIIKSIEIIGEAASKVTETFKTENKTDLPDLIKALEEIIPPKET